MSDREYDILTPKLGFSPELNQEYLLVMLNPGEWVKIYLHDYSSIFPHAGLYEQIFVRHLHSNSHHLICDNFMALLKQKRILPQDLCVLELGAGNGVTGECFFNAGFKSLTAVDTLDWAKRAACRDRPKVYAKYNVGDILSNTPEMWRTLAEPPIDVLLIVAAIGMGHLPSLAIRHSFNLLRNGGFLVFNIYSKLLSGWPQTEFVALLHAISGASMRLFREEYCHRKSIDGSEVIYVMYVFEKRQPIALN